MSAEGSEAIEIQSPHTRWEYAEPSAEAPRPFAGGGLQLPPDLVTRVLAADDDEYDPELAYVLAVVAGWSYSDAQTLANKLKYYALPDVSVEAIAVTNPAMLIVASAFFVRSSCGRLGILAFRGTEPANVISWLTDTDVEQRPFGKGAVHQGFYANLEAVWEEIGAQLERATTLSTHPRANRRVRAPLRRLFVTGHSLGGAMAVLTAARLARDDNFRDLVHGVYTFGQPAVGNRAFADECDGQFGKRLYRHLYAHDVVPHLPPAWDDRFVHFGAERITFSTNKSWVVPEETGRQVRWLLPAVASCATAFVTRRLPLLEHVPLPYSLDDHSPARYIEASRVGLARPAPVPSTCAARDA